VILSLLALLPGCGDRDAADVPLHDRLWLTAVPKSVKDSVGVLTIVRASESRQYGWIFKGSLLRGVYDTFHWQPDGEHRAHMRMLQDDKVYKIRTEACEPSTGFHYCVLVHGDPQGEVRYESRKLWGLTRPKAKGSAFDLASELERLAGEDPELAVLLEQAEVP
jgi:hypothetical protein